MTKEEICPECGYQMDFEVLEKMGACWICDQCGRMLRLHIYTASNGLSREERKPRFHSWDNRSSLGWIHWAFGWKTGIDNDLICIFPNINSRVQEHYALSPACSNRFLALIAFLIKRLLFLLDPDLRYRRNERDGN